MTPSDCISYRCDGCMSGRHFHILPLDSATVVLPAPVTVTVGTPIRQEKP